MHVQVYDATKRELHSLKKQLKEAEENGRTTRDKVSEGHSAAKSYGLDSGYLHCHLRLQGMNQKSTEQAHSTQELTSRRDWPAKAEQQGREEAKQDLERGEMAAHVGQLCGGWCATAVQCSL